MPKKGLISPGFKLLKKFTHKIVSALDKTTSTLWYIMIQILFRHFLPSLNYINSYFEEYQKIKLQYLVENTRKLVEQFLKELSQQSFIFFFRNKLFLHFLNNSALFENIFYLIDRFKTSELCSNVSRIARF